MPEPTPAQKALKRVLAVSRFNGWSVIIVAGLGILLTLVALRLLAWPRTFFTLLGRISQMSATGVRLLGLVGVVFGVLLALVGVSMS